MLAALLEFLEVVLLLFLLVLELLAVLLVLWLLVGPPLLELVSLQVFVILALLAVPVLWLAEVAAESVIDLLIFLWLLLLALPRQGC